MKERIQNGTELYHHGILGQKWGVRRFQNPDGTRTAAGKKRYSDEERAAIKAERKAARTEKREAKQQIKRDYKQSRKINSAINNVLINSKYDPVNKKYVPADQDKYRELTSKAMDFVKNHPDYEINPEHAYTICAGYLNGVYWDAETTGVGIDVVRGTDAHKYGKRKAAVELAAVGGTYIAGIAALMKYCGAI